VRHVALELCSSGRGRRRPHPLELSKAETQVSFQSASRAGILWKEGRQALGPHRKPCRARARSRITGGVCRRASRPWWPSPRRRRSTQYAAPAGCHSAGTITKPKLRHTTSRSMNRTEPPEDPIPLASLRSRYYCYPGWNRAGHTRLTATPVSERANPACSGHAAAVLRRARHRRQCANGCRGQGLTLVPISAQLELTLRLSAQLKLTSSPI